MSKSLSIFFVFLLSTCSLVLCDTNLQTPCYYPNGTQTSQNLIACDADSKGSSSETMSHCCVKGEACISNGLCFSPAKGFPYRGACTVSDWASRNDSRCPTWCTDWNNGWGWADIAFCGALGKASYWCSNEPHTPSTRCQNPLYSWPASLSGTLTVKYLPVNGYAGNRSATNATVDTIDGREPQQNDHKLAVGLGVGLGVPLAMALGSLAYLIWKMRNMERTSRLALLHHQGAEKIGVHKWQGQYVQVQESSAPSEVDTERHFEADGNSRSELSERQFHSPLAERSAGFTAYEPRTFHSQ